MYFSDGTLGRISQQDYARYALSLLPAGLLINLLTGLLVTAILLPWQETGVAVVACQIAGLSMLSGALAMRWVREFLLPPQPEGLPWHLFIGVPAGLLLGCILIVRMLHEELLRLQQYRHPATVLLLIIACSVLATSYFSLRYRVAREHWRRQRAVRATAAARLRALQAQVEPHFLFNTLANLNALICQSPHEARRLLEHLQHYLRASLAHGRGTSTSLSTELSLLEAYLRIMAIRLPDRLHARVSCAPQCADLPFPPMLLQPLVENAVIHGIEPSTAGGEISVDAFVIDRQLHIEVRDSGIGLQDAGATPRGNGTGLQNVRERLNALFGRHGRLQISADKPRGTRISISIRMASLIAAAK